MRNEHISAHCLANNLALLIEKRNITPNQLAQALHLPLMTIRRLLSSETEDPRVSTLKIIADYFDVSIDFLMHDHAHASTLVEQHMKTYRVPKRSWDDLTKLEHTSLQHVQAWQPILIGYRVSAGTFALESKPSMSPRFPKGTLFILDPELSPKDGDIVLVHFKKNNSHTLKELIIDPPEMRLNPLVADSQAVDFNPTEHSIIAIVVATLFYQHQTQA
jgi:transcriptional regulator with XRE-family HTH domain